MSGSYGRDHGLWFSDRHNDLLGIEHHWVHHDDDEKYSGHDNSDRCDLFVVPVHEASLSVSHLYLNSPDLE